MLVLGGLPLVCTPMLGQAIILQTVFESLEEETPFKPVDFLRQDVKHGCVAPLLGELLCTLVSFEYVNFESSLHRRGSLCTNLLRYTCLSQRSFPVTRGAYSGVGERCLECF